MKIGFLGCGAMGSIYAGNLTKAHEVYIFDAMPAVCELDGPDMIGPRESNRLSSLAD